MNACESCGERPSTRVTFHNPYTDGPMTEDLCADCGAWVVSDEGQHAMLQDAVEQAEHAAGWYA